MPLHTWLGVALCFSITAFNPAIVRERTKLLVAGLLKRPELKGASWRAYAISADVLTFFLCLGIGVYVTEVLAASETDVSEPALSPLSVMALAAVISTTWPFMVLGLARLSGVASEMRPIMDGGIKPVSQSLAIVLLYTSIIAAFLRP
ncbi:MAG: hypothetical protein AAGF78_12925 [Pseudomonadota bacterium]